RDLEATRALVDEPLAHERRRVDPRPELADLAELVRVDAQAGTGGVALHARLQTRSPTGRAAVARALGVVHARPEASVPWVEGVHPVLAAEAELRLDEHESLRVQDEDDRVTREEPLELELARLADERHDQRAAARKRVHAHVEPEAVAVHLAHTPGLVRGVAL